MSSQDMIPFEILFSPRVFAALSAIQAPASLIDLDKVTNWINSKNWNSLEDVLRDQGGEDSVYKWKHCNDPGVVGAAAGGGDDTVYTTPSCDDAWWTTAASWAAEQYLAEATANPDSLAFKPSVAVKGNPGRLSTGGLYQRAPAKQDATPPTSTGTVVAVAVGAVALAAVGYYAYSKSKEAPSKNPCENPSQAANLKRFNQFFTKNLEPKYVHVYDNGGETFDRYTVVFTGKYRHKTGGAFWYVGMSEHPFHPQGFGQHGESDKQIDYPTYGHLGKKIKFSQLPTDPQKLVVTDYLDLNDVVPTEELAKKYGIRGAAKASENPARKKLRSETENATVEREVRRLAKKYAPEADQIFPAFEHGQWFVTVSPDPDDPSDENSEATFSVVDTNRGLDLERL